MLISEGFRYEQDFLAKLKWEFLSSYCFFVKSTIDRKSRSKPNKPFFEISFLSQSHFFTRNPFLLRLSISVRFFGKALVTIFVKLLFYYVKNTDNQKYSFKIQNFSFENVKFMKKLFFRKKILCQNDQNSFQKS